jgi:hypothetical protein
MILKTKRYYFHYHKLLSLNRISLHPSWNRKLYKGIDTFLHKKMFSFRLATGGIDSAVYKKMIAPFMNDLPASHSDGYRRVCADQNYEYVGPYIMNTNLSLSLSCQLGPLPETSYRDQWVFIISKNSSYKGQINWRWDNKMKSIRYITDKSRHLWVPRKSLKTEGHVCLLFVTRDLPTGMYESFVTFLRIVICCRILF